MLTFRPRAAASGASVAEIWVASSRVGASTRPDGREGRRLPERSRADQRDGERQRLAAAGLAAAQDVTAGEGVGKGVDLDRERRGDSLLLRARWIRDSGTPSSAKVLGVVMFSVPLGHRLRRVAATALSCSWWVQGWRDCRSAKSIAAKKALDVGAFHDAVGILAPTLFPTLADQPLITRMR